MWNNGNGNGNNNGNWNNQGQGQPQYGQQAQYGQSADSVYDTMKAQTLTHQQRDPFIGEGQHVLAVISIEEFFSQNAGPCVRASFEVLESKTHPVGSTVGAMWAMLKPAPKPGMTRDQDRFVDFITRLKGAPAGYPIGQDIRTLLKDRPTEQLARGTVIHAQGTKKTSKTTGKDYVLVAWNHAEQTQESVAQMRQKLDAKYPAGPQRNTQGGQFQGAPHPAQQNTQGGYAPQGPQQPQGQQFPPQGYGPQAGAPQIVPNAQGWGQQPAQGPPPGGYLANVPPQNNGGNGNQGGGW